MMGVYYGEYQTISAANPDAIDAYSATGNAHAVAVGRIAYLLGLRGPAVAIDSACSSSLVTIHLACQSLRLRESDLALAGGVSLILRPETQIAMAKWGMLSPNGRCYSFDSRADGFVRGEGCGVVVLKRLTDAVRDGDRVLAVVRGSAVNQDGRSNGLTAPNTIAQQDVIRSALRSADVTAGSVNYIEAHGTGTGLGDPIEFEALADQYGRGDGHCALGAVKSNFGHLEAAAGHRRIHQGRAVGAAVPDSAEPQLLAMESGDRPQIHPAVRAHRAQPVAGGGRPAPGRHLVVRHRRDERARRDRAGPGSRAGVGCRVGISGDDADDLRQDRAADRLLGDGAGRLDGR